MIAVSLEGLRCALFDFDGHLIAFIVEPSKPDQNFHVPIESFHANWIFSARKLISYDSM